MAVNVFRLTILLTLAFAGYYFLSDDPRVRRARRSVGSNVGRCTFTQPSGSPITLIYDQLVDQAGAQALCASQGAVLADVSAIPGTQKLGDVVAASCPGAPPSVGTQVFWIGSIDGNPQAGCLGLKGVATGGYATNVLSCKTKNAVACTAKKIAATTKS
ncbi:hypothetical protein HKX48_001286 [Thoreauomyces humboldtii]|nr:hypothetical protein HKX48_001286 [Thoreauomyces humboldtii]